MLIGRNISKIFQAIKMYLAKKHSNLTHHEICPFIHPSGHFIMNMSFENEVNLNPGFAIIHVVEEEAGSQPPWHTELLNKKHVTPCS